MSCSKSFPPGFLIHWPLLTANLVIYLWHWEEPTLSLIEESKKPLWNLCGWFQFNTQCTEIKPGVLETVETLGVIIKSHLSLKDAVGKRLFERQHAKVVVLKTGQNLAFFTLGYCSLVSPLLQIVPIPVIIHLVKSLVGDFYLLPLKMQVQSTSPLVPAPREGWSKSVMLPLSSLRCDWGASNPAGLKLMRRRRQNLLLQLLIFIWFLDLFVDLRTKYICFQAVF